MIRIAGEEGAELHVEPLAQSGVWFTHRDFQRPRMYRVSHAPSGRCLDREWGTSEKALEALRVLGTRVPEWASDAEYGAVVEVPACCKDLP